MVLGKRDILVADRLDLDLLRKRHPVAGQDELWQHARPEYPHPRLGILDRVAVKQQHRDGEHRVTHLVGKIHRLGILERKPGRRDEVEFVVYQIIDQLRDLLGRVRAIAVECDDDVTLGRRQTRFVSGAVTLAAFKNHPRAQRRRHLRGPVGAVIIDDDHLVHTVRESFDDVLDTLFFVITGNDDAYFQIAMHGNTSL